MKKMLGACAIEILAEISATEGVLSDDLSRQAVLHEVDQPDPRISTFICSRQVLLDDGTTEECDYECDVSFDFETASLEIEDTRGTPVCL
jgi:hypothetical protein